MPLDGSDVSIQVMRVHVWLVVSLVLAHHPGIAAAEGREPESVPEVDATTGTSTIITQQKRERLIATDVVTARVYSTGGISGDALRVAFDVARAAFAAAAVEINWKICGLADCNTPPLPKEILIRFMQSRGRHIDTRCLGEALIDKQKGMGVLATVYVDRVRHLARNLEIDHSILLGRTMAHEIGHLLLATSTHGTSGLMREVWSREELLGDQADHWVLQPFEVAAIRKRLAPSRAGEQHAVAVF